MLYNHGADLEAETNNNERPSGRFDVPFPIFFLSSLSFLFSSLILLCFCSITLIDVTLLCIYMVLQFLIGHCSRNSIFLQIDLTEDEELLEILTELKESGRKLVKSVKRSQSNSSRR